MLLRMFGQFEWGANETGPFTTQTHAQKLFWLWFQICVFFLSWLLNFKIDEIFRDKLTKSIYASHEQNTNSLCWKYFQMLIEFKWRQLSVWTSKESIYHERWWNVTTVVSRRAVGRFERRWNGKCAHKLKLMTCCDGIATMKSLNYFRNILKINFDYVPHYGDIFDTINTTHP